MFFHCALSKGVSVLLPRDMCESIAIRSIVHGVSFPHLPPPRPSKRYPRLLRVCIIKNLGGAGLRPSFAGREDCCRIEGGREACQAS